MLACAYGAARGVAWTMNSERPATAAALASPPIMLDLPQQVLQERRETMTNAILEYNALYPGHAWYALVCPCNLNCGHMPQEEIPRIMLPECYYPGEYDFFLSNNHFSKPTSLKSGGTVMNAIMS